MIKRFAIYGLVGWCTEVFWTGMGSLWRGDSKLTCTTYLWMFFIYGLAIFLEPIHDRMRNANFIIRGVIYTIIIFATEYSTGLILKLVLGECPWDYTFDGGISINGLIRLDYAPAWFIAGLAFERIHDKLIKLEAFAAGEKKHAKFVLPWRKRVS